MMNVYNGNIITDKDGNAVVELPGYFESLNKDFRYQLTVVGQFAQAIVMDKVLGNKFTIKTDKPWVEVSWQVTGIRQDAWANSNRIPNEVDKPKDEVGTYQNPEAFGKSASMGASFAIESKMSIGDKTNSITNTGKEPEGLRDTMNQQRKESHPITTRVLESQSNNSNTDIIPDKK